MNRWNELKRETSVKSLQWLKRKVNSVKKITSRLIGPSRGGGAVVGRVWKHVTRYR